MTRCIAFHSYKGGTGKTTLASNFAALLAKKGYRVFLLDLDVYAPSLQSYFEKEPKRWINDFLSGTAEIEEIMMDITSIVVDEHSDYNRSNNSSSYSKEKGFGKFWVGFCNSKKEEIYKLEGGGGKQDNSKIQLLRRFILLREQLISNFDADYIIIDTSPGIRYWSINALAVADTLFLTLKMGDLDIEGTKRMADEIYSSLKKFGAKPYFLLNKVAGYCVPKMVGTSTSTSTPVNASSSSSLPHSHDHNDQSTILVQQEAKSDDISNMLSSEMGMEVISAIPCYCDIQFSRKEFLTVLKYPEHPFAKQIELLSEQIQMKD